MMGDAAFRASLRGHVAEDPEVPERWAVRHRPTAVQILCAVARAEGVTPASLVVSRRGRGVTTPARALAMYLCQEVAGMRLQAIADTFGLRSYAGAAASIRDFRRRVQADTALARRVTRLRRQFVDPA